MRDQVMYKPNLENVSETLLVPLFFKAKETLEKGIIQDDAAVEIIKRLEYNFDKMETDKHTQLLITIRTAILDRIVNEYIRSEPNPVIINLGAGLDTRHLRLKEAKWYQLDLKKPMELRQIFFNKEICIIRSILDFSWMDEVKEHENVLIIIEGVLMYLDEEQVKSIFQAVGKSFRNSQIVFDTIPKSFIKLKEHKSINMQSAPFKWGNSRVSEIEKWNFGLKKLQNYRYLSKYIRRWKSSAFLSIFQNVYNGFKISLMQIN